MNTRRTRYSQALMLVAGGILGATAGAHAMEKARRSAGASVTVTDVAAGPAIGLVSYERTLSARDATLRAFHEGSLTMPISDFDIIETPMRPHGIPGVAAPGDLQDIRHRLGRRDSCDGAGFGEANLATPEDLRDLWQVR